MPGSTWWTKLRAKLKGSKSKSGSAEKLRVVEDVPFQDRTVTESEVTVHDRPSAEEAIRDIQRELLPYERMQDALISAAPSEPVSMASSAVSGGPGLFTSAAVHMGAGLLPRMAAPASGQSAFMGDTSREVLPVLPQQVVVDPSFEMHSLDGRAEAGAAEPTRVHGEPPVEPAAAEAQPKLTAATLGTHSTLSEGVVRAHRGHRKMHFIKNWLNDAQTEAEPGAAAASTVPAPEPNSDGSRGSSLPVGGPAQAGASRSSPSPSSPLIQLKIQGDSPQAKSGASPTPHGLTKAMNSLEHLRSLHESTLSSGTPGTATGATSGVAISSLITRDAFAQPLQHNLALPVAATAAPTAQPSAGPAALPESSQPPLPAPQQLPPPQPGLFPRTSVRRVASHNAAVASGEASAGDGGAGRMCAEQDGVAAGARWQSRPESEQLENYLASAVTTMTVTSQVEGPEIPKRVAVPSTCSNVTAHNQRASETPNPSALRLPSAASHESTKTIAVAGHCPEDIAAQQWSVDDFVLQRKLYEGALSVICHAQHKKSGRLVALKIYKRSRLHEMERFQLAREICLHIRILHPHILSLYAAWKDSKYVYLVLEWAPHGNLFELLATRGGKLPEAEAARHIIRPLLSSLAFLHSHSWLHRDIKLENVLLDAQGLVKLCDFGLAIDQKFEQANTRLGTFGYFAPEVLDCPLKKGPFDFKGEPGVPTYGCKVDVWSLGVMSYELLTGKAPFAASSAAKIIDAIRSRDVAYPASLSPGAKAFLSAALVRDPEQRATAEQLLQHPWILSCCAAGSSVSSRTNGGDNSSGIGN